MRNCHLLVEGIDRSGKDSFIKAWLEHFPHYAYKEAPVQPTANATSRQFVDMFYELCYSSVPQIWNRSHISEMVYAPLYHPHTYTDSLRNLFVEGEDQITSEPGLPVYILYFEPVYLEYCKPDTDRGAAKQLPAEIEGYAYVLDWTTLPIIPHWARHKDGWRTMLAQIASVETEIRTLQRGA